jgi:transcriptional regulator with XRE-family HTH domain
VGLSSAPLANRAMEDVRAILARNIKAARKRLNLSQEDLADRAGIDRTYVSGIERQVRNPTITVVAKFAEALETTTADLLGARR